MDKVGFGRREEPSRMTLRVTHINLIGLQADPELGSLRSFFA